MIRCDMVRALIVVTFVACHPTSTSIEPAHDPFALAYAGVTTCGREAPAAAPTPPTTPSLPEREPVPAFTIPPREPVPTLPPLHPATPRIESSGMTSNDIDHTMRTRGPILRACFERLLAQDPAAGSFTVQTHFTVLEDGTVAGVEVGTREPVDELVATLDRCVCDALATTSFPAPDARATVSYPLMFSSGR